MSQPKLPQIISEIPGPNAKELLRKSHEYLSSPESRRYPDLVLADGFGAICVTLMEMCF